MPPYWLNERILNPLVEHLPMERVIPDKMIRAMVVKATAGGGPLPPHLIGHMVDHIPDQMRVHKYSVLPVTGRHEMRDWARDLRDPDAARSTATTIRSRLWRRWRSSPACCRTATA